MAKISTKDAIISAVNMTDGSAPTTPEAGANKIYFKSGVMYKINSAGTETAFSTGTGDVVGPASAVASNIVTFDGTTGKLVKDSGAIVPAYIHVREQQASGTAGGTFTAGAWRTRVINTEVSDAGGFCSIASNQITLAAGTYIARVTAPAKQVSYHVCKLYNVTDGADVLIGVEAEDGGAAITTRSEAVGKFTIAAPKVFEVQHQCGATKATNGLGGAAGFGVIEIFAQAEFWKVA